MTMTDSSDSTPDDRRDKAPDGRKAVRGRGRPVGDRDAKRAELLAAAMTVIAQIGYGNASLRKVASHAGQTTGAVTYYFANKDEMTAAVIEALFDRFDALLAQMEEAGDLRALLTQYLQQMHPADYETSRLLAELLTASRQEPAFAQIVRRRNAALRVALAALLARKQEAGAIRADIPAEYIAELISALSDGWSLMLPVEPARFTPGRMAQLIDQTVRLFSPPKAAP